MLILAILVVVAAIVLLARRVDVRLVLLGAGLMLCVLAGTPLLAADTFTRGMVTAMVAPICASMGFAAVIARTGCDAELVRLLLAPLSKVRALALPGGILAAYIVNLAIPSQASTAASLGPILIPLLTAAGFDVAVSGAALILGASFGGDLLNPGAQDVQSIAGVASVSSADISTLVVPASLAGIAAAATAFALFNRPSAPVAPRARTGMDGDGAIESAAGAAPRVNVLKALVPVLPVTMLLLAYAGWEPMRWLVTIPEGDAWKPLTGALPVVRAMLLGTVVAGALAWRDVRSIARSLFEGMGHAYGSIISLTITAQVFGAGVAAAGIADALLRLASGSSALALLSTAFPWALSVLSGSGSGPILAYAQTFLASHGADPHLARNAALACLGGAFGRTSSPVSAVVVYSSGLVDRSPLVVLRLVLVPLLIGAAVSIVVVLLR
jgi:DcuC family C4-dicarboxylate transporter